ncbi:hypothetical protein PIB30_077781 [Stylosanthes scabra]|uniref:Uncharacterized protein n=1 Tax=Stylosanthes scabra TaxID=79078 RepID=A0ABU6QT04_9FABA|nr:hypothetical protein [Stylosanthes scabra]
MAEFAESGIQTSVLTDLELSQYLTESFLQAYEDMMVRNKNLGQAIPVANLTQSYFPSNGRGVEGEVADLIDFSKVEGTDGRILGLSVKYVEEEDMLLPIATTAMINNTHQQPTIRMSPHKFLTQIQQSHHHLRLFVSHVHATPPHHLCLIHLGLKTVEQVTMSPLIQTTFSLLKH